MFQKRTFDSPNYPKKTGTRLRNLLQAKIVWFFKGSLLSKIDSKTSWTLVSSSKTEFRTSKLPNSELSSLEKSDRNFFLAICFFQFEFLNNIIIFCDITKTTIRTTQKTDEDYIFICDFKITIVIFFKFCKKNVITTEKKALDFKTCGFISILGRYLGSRSLWIHFFLIFVPFSNTFGERKRLFSFYIYYNNKSKFLLSFNRRQVYYTIIQEKQHVRPQSH